MVLLSDGDPIREKELRRMNYYSYLQRIFTLNKKAKAEQARLKAHQ